MRLLGSAVVSALNSQFKCSEYTDRTLSVGKWDCTGESWLPILVCRG